MNSKCYESDLQSIRLEANGLNVVRLGQLIRNSGNAEFPYPTVVLSFKITVSNVKSLSKNTVSYLSFKTFSKHILLNDYQKFV